MRSAWPSAIAPMRPPCAKMPSARRSACRSTSRPATRRSLGSPSAGSTTRRRARCGGCSRTDGRSRAFINGQPVNLQDLQALGGLLVDIHGQHAHQSLLDTGNQRALLDAHDEIAPLATTVAEQFRDVANVARAAREPALVERPAARPRSSCCVSKWPSSKRSGLVDGEPERLRAERDRLANTDRLMSGVSAALDALADNEAVSAYSAVILARRELEKLADVDAALRAPAAALASIEIELREAETTLQHYRDRIEADPARLSVARRSTRPNPHARAAPRRRRGRAARHVGRAARRGSSASTAAAIRWRRWRRTPRKRARNSSTRRAKLSDKRAAARGRAWPSRLEACWSSSACRTASSASSCSRNPSNARTPRGSSASSSRSS